MIGNIPGASSWGSKLNCHTPSTNANSPVLHVIPQRGGSGGVILRKVSRFVTGTQEDGVIPVPVFYDVVTGKILVELLPKELRAEFEENTTDHSMD